MKTSLGKFRRPPGLAAVCATWRPELFLGQAHRRPRIGGPNLRESELNEGQATAKCYCPTPGGSDTVKKKKKRNESCVPDTLVQSCRAKGRPGLGGGGLMREKLAAGVVKELLVVHKLQEWI